MTYDEWVKKFFEDRRTEYTYSRKFDGKRVTQEVMIKKWEKAFGQYQGQDDSVLNE